MLGVAFKGRRIANNRKVGKVERGQVIDSQEVRSEPNQLENDAGRFASAGAGHPWRSLPQADALHIRQIIPKSVAHEIRSFIREDEGARKKKE
jgi:hypothetical protein